MDKFGWLRIFRAHLWVGVPFWNTFMDVCDCLEHIYGWMCLFLIHLLVDVAV